MTDHLLTRRAIDRDAEAVHALLVAAGEELARQGYLNWTPPFSPDRVRADIRDREIYVVHDGAALVATYMLGGVPPRPYSPEPWPTPSLTALYLNRLAVDPRRQREGVGGWCLRDVEHRARSAGALAIRCDVLEANRRLRAFYERHGYIKRGSRSHSGFQFTSYELLLAP